MKKIYATILGITISLAVFSQTSYYINDNNATGDLFTSAIGSDANAGTAASPFATLLKALNTSVAGDIIYVDAGSYTEQVNITKAITIRGAGKGVTIINSPAAPLSQLPNSFDVGIIQADANLGDVNIESLTIDGTNSISGFYYGIFIQESGRISNCEMRNVTNGVLVRDMSGTARTVVVNNNYIHQIKYFGGFFLGSGLQVTATGNVIDFNGAPFGMALLAGDRSPEYVINSFTATNNSIINHNGFGILVNSTQPSIVRNNSITAIAGPSIEVLTTAAVDATCNWFGNADANEIIPRVKYYMGNPNYSPWLSNGTDNDVAIGFQPLPDVCNGRQNKFYVNDAYNPGVDVFTTAVGNNGNPGISSAPLATISAAYQKAQTGDSIFVDAGTYTAVDGTIAKSISIFGSNYLLSPNSIADPLLINSTRNAETIISNTNWTIGANDIRIKGFTFDPQSKTALAQTNNTLDFDNVEISKNIFLAKSTSAIVNLTGKQQSPLVTTNYVINDNRFVKESGGGGNNISINTIDAVQINNNVFTTNNTIVNNARIQNGIVVGNLAGDVVIFNNKGYQQNFFINAQSAKKTTISFNSADECNRFAFSSSGNVNPNELEITDNIVTNPRSTGGPVISYARSNGTNLSSPNIARIERNTIILNGTGLTSVAQALIAPTLDAASANTQVYIRDNKLTITGDFSTQSNPGLYVSAIRFLTNSRYALVENNEMEFTAINYNGSNKFGIGLLTSGLQPGTGFNFLNNKFSGFPTSIGIQNGGVYGELPAGVVLNINYNSFTSDVMSINNGTTGQSANAGCNWYGSAAAQNFISKLTLPTVDIVPWLTNGTDNNVATGFQQVPGSCDGYPTLITLNSSTNVTCNGAANGTINVTTSYGKAPFTYTWTKDGDANFVSNNEDPTGLAPGTYRLAILDGNGSNIYITDPEADGPGTIDVTITEPPALTATPSGFNVSCFGGLNGSASVTAGGGTLPYTYLWSNGSTSASISNLSAGIYSVTVTDGNGCTKSTSYEITQPALLTATGSGTNVSCFGGSNGTATVTVGGGTLPYTYVWSTGGTTQSISGLAIGIYNVTVTDGNGCTKSASYQVTQPTLLTAVASGTSTSCANTATVVASGGTLPYSYAWSNGATTQSISSIPAGTYTVIVTDNKGCTASSSVTVTANQAFNPSASVTNVLCFGGSTGSITITNVNGVSPFQFSLNGVNFSAPAPLPFTFSGLAAGTYTITVKDANGCTGFVTKTITDPALLVVTQGSVQSTCSGQGTGSITVTTTGGSGSLSYSWTGPGGYTSTQKNISGLATGTYSLTVTDANGCSKNLSVNVPVYAAINVSANITNVSCFGSANGSIDLTVTGGTGSGFTYLWNSGATTQDRFNLAPGTNYKVTITDIGSGCQLQRTDTITQPSALGLNTVSKSDVNGCISMGVIEVAGTGGTTPYQYKLNYNGSYQTSGLFQGLPGISTGITDTVWIKDANGCTTFKSYIIKDDGKDGYENNNGKNSATVISIGAPASAKAVNGDIDYFKLNGTNTWTGSYTLALSQTPSSVTYYLTQSNGATIVQASDSSATYKHYNALSGNYFVKVNSGTSYNCYQLTVSSGIITRSSGISVQQEMTKAPVNDGFFDVKVFGNPSSTGFTMNIITSSAEKMSIRVFDAQGRLIEQRQSLQPYETLRIGERYINGVYMAEIRQSKNIKTIRLVKM
jgi:hypothetical protein